MYADDTNLSVSGNNIPEIESMLQHDVDCVADWLCANKLTLNVIKTEYMMIGSRQRLATFAKNLNLSLNGIALKQAKEVTCLGLKIDENLTWKGHVKNITKKVSTNLRIIKKAKPYLNQNLLISV